MYRDLNEFQWQLDVDRWSLDDDIIDLLFACDMLQENHMSLRRCSEEVMIPKSTIHKFIHTKLRLISSELYRLCIKQLTWNKSHIDSFMFKQRKDKHTN